MSCLICGKPIEDTSPSTTFCIKHENLNARISLALAGVNKNDDFLPLDSKKESDQT